MWLVVSNINDERFLQNALIFWNLFLIPCKFVSSRFTLNSSLLEVVCFLQDCFSQVWQCAFFLNWQILIQCIILLFSCLKISQLKWLESWVCKVKSMTPARVTKYFIWINSRFMQSKYNVVHVFSLPSHLSLQYLLLMSM